MDWRRRRPNVLIFQKAILWIWRCCNSAWELMSVTWHLRYAFPLFKVNTANSIITGSICAFKTSTQHQRIVKPQRNPTIAQLSYSSQRGKSCKGIERLAYLWCLKLWLLDIAYLECSMLLNGICGFIWIMRALGKGYRWQHCKVDDFSCKMESLVGDIAFWKVSILSLSLSPCFGWINMLMLCP